MMLNVSDIAVAIKSKAILKGLSLDAGRGWTGVLGVNGSGKTTLLRALCGRLPLSGGRIVWQGADVTLDDAGRAKAFGFAPPVDSLPVGLKAGELIELTADLRGVESHSPAEIRRSLGLDALENRLIGAMSSGMKQRVSLFCAFLGQPDLVLLDEPFNWLDPVAAFDFKREVRAYAEERVVITALHDVETFVTRCDTGLVIHDGQVLQTFNANRMAAARHKPLELEAEIYGLFPR